MIPNPNFPDHRYLKNRLNNFTKKWQNSHRDHTSIYVIDCRWHPCKVLTFGWHPQDLYGASLDVESLIDGLVSSCSMFHCGITDVNEIKAFEMRDYYHKYGEHRYFIDIIGYSEKDLGELEDAMGLPRST
jgi:hypothetical protein